MLVLVVYDIQTITKDGKARLHQVAKHCERIGTRVQASVFECLLDAEHFRCVKELLLSMIDPSCDQIRFYNLGNHYESRIEQLGHCIQNFHENPIIL